MTYATAQQIFERIVSDSRDPDISAIAQGLLALTQAIQYDIQNVKSNQSGLERDLHSVKNRVNSIRG